jgi:hypothetical protein
MTQASSRSLSSDRARRHTAASVLERIDEKTTYSLLQAAQSDAATIATKLEALDREWDTDRVIEVEAATVGLLGLALGCFVRPAFLAIPGVIGGAVLVQALTGWYPLLPVFRRLGVRSAREIERERYGLKAARGDFSCMPGEMPGIAAKPQDMSSAAKPH